VEIVGVRGISRYVEKDLVYAYLIKADYVAQGVEFVTDEQSEFQLGIMTRGLETPVSAHMHNRIDRVVHTTSEYLYFRSGSAKVSLRSSQNADPVRIDLDTGDSILFTGIGIHSILFAEGTQLIEIKQGPFDPSLDKVYLSHLEE
jgi:mannose-6-phosphate isomerase-like protein (cupin superfamily)